MTDGLLLVHAFPMDASMWEEQVRAIADRVPCVAVDLPGFGGSDPAGEVMTMAVAAERCTDELDRAGMNRAVVCGLSMGGYVTLELWRRHRDRILGLVLANTRAEPDAEEGRKRRREVADLVLAEGPAAILDSMRALVSLDAATETWERVADIVMRQPAEAVAAASRGMAERPDSRPDLPGIDVPTLVITSSGDRLIAQDTSAPMAEAIPEAELAVIEGAGHLSNMEQPEEFTRLLEIHLERCGLLPAVG
ncbi:MAG: alpha/beta fold hydrolase [Actinomycetota bacterium]